MKTLEIITIVCLCASVVLLAADEITTESQEPQPTMISIGSLDSGWQLIINRDGSGKLMYGSSIGDMGLIKTGTYDFWEMYRVLSNPQKWSEEKTDVSVGFIFDRTDANYGKYLKDEHMWLELVDKAQRNLTSPNADRIIDLLNKCPAASSLKKSGISSRLVDTETKNQEGKEEKAKFAITALCRGRSGGSEQEIENAIAILKEGSNTRDDDLALIALNGIQRNLTGMRGAEWAPAVVSNYYECVSHLKTVRLDAETKKNWRRYSELKDMLCELNGGDKMLSLVIRGQLLVELKQYVDRAETANERDVQEIKAFIRTESKAILQEWPEPELRRMIEKLAADQ